MVKGRSGGKSVTALADALCCPGGSKSSGGKSALVALCATLVVLVFIIHHPISLARGQWASRTALSDAQITQLCEKYKVEPPPELGPSADHAAFAEAFGLLNAHGKNAMKHNKTFMRQLLPRLTLEERERLAYESLHYGVFYIGAEVQRLNEAQKAAVLKAAPLPDVAKLNGVNVGAGGLPLHDSLIGIDAHRGLPEDAGGIPASQRTSPNTVLAWADELPFRSSSIDFLVSTHNLEHLNDPVAAVLHYLDIVKPGGGVGIVVPHWEYAWDARNSTSEWGHRWNSAPEVVCEMFHRHWSHLADLESLATMPFRLAFDFVLRKKGAFVPFPSDSAPTYPTGRQRWCSGSFIGPHDMRPGPKC